MPTPRPRKPRFRRVAPRRPVQLTGRDFAILDLISRHRFLRSDHLTTLISGSAQHLVRRFGRLYHAGQVERPSHQLRLAERSAPLVYCLAEKGRRELQRRGHRVFASVPHLRRAGSAFQLAHDLRVSDVLVALQSATEDAGLRFRLHHDWSPTPSGSSALRPLRWMIRLPGETGPHSIRVIPDGAFSLHDEDDGSAFFVLEVDRGTMPVKRSDLVQTSFLRKIQAYRQTRQAGVLWKRWNVPGFRVLVVTESAARMRSLQHATADCFQHGRSTMFLFAVAQELLRAENIFSGPWQNCMGEPAILFQQKQTD